MTKTKRTISLLLTACLLATLAASCGNSAQPAAPEGESTGNTGDTGNKEVVRMVVPGISDESTMDPISGITSLGLGDFEKFLEERIPDVDLDLMSIPWDGWIQKIEAMVTADEMDVGFYTNQVAVPDWYMDLTPYLEKDETVNFDTLKNFYIDPAVHYTTYKSFNYPEATGKVFGLPMTVACNTIVYDKQIFADWGVEVPAENVTFEELIAMSEKMTGKNPVTGQQNYGAYAKAMWMEWYAISYDAVKPMTSEDMMLSGLDMDKYVNYIKDSEEVLNYMKGMERIVAASPEGVSTGTGSEKFFTPDNDIAINFDTNSVSGAMMKYYYAESKEVTDRFVPITIPTGKNGQQGFPEFFRFSVTKNAKNPDKAWEVVKQLTTNKEIVDFYLTNYASDKIPALKDTEGMKMMEYDINQKRQDYLAKTIFITDDYWTWRVPLQDVNNLLLSKEITAEDGRQKFYDGVVAWVDNTKAQLGQ